MMRYLIGFLGIIAIIILIIVLLVRGGGSDPKTDIDLADYLTGTSQVRMTVEGQVAASENRYVSRISVNQDEATIDVIQGYEGDVIRSKSYPMNPNAYAEFLLSLRRAGFTVGNDNSDMRDQRGYCPLGSRNIYELYDDGKQVLRYWNTSCDPKQGTFKGNTSLVTTLFRLQIPAYNELTSDLNFGGSGRLL